MNQRESERDREIERDRQTERVGKMKREKDYVVLSTELSTTGKKNHVLISNHISKFFVLPFFINPL